MNFIYKIYPTCHKMRNTVKNKYIIILLSKNSWGNTEIIIIFAT